MKRLCSLIVALLLSPSFEYPRYYVSIVFQDHNVYEEYMDYKSACVALKDFYDDNSIESVFFTRDINYVP